MDPQHALRLKNLHINTYKETVIYMRPDCHVCRSEGFETPVRVAVTLKGKTIIATLNFVESDLLALDEASLSTYAWELLQAHEGEMVQVFHPKALESIRLIRNKINNKELHKAEIDLIVKDLVAGYLSDIQISAFLAGCGDNRLSKNEILNLTQAMVETGNRLQWPQPLVVDKHCVGGLPGNRTSLIVVPIVTAFGLLMPKTSSRAITSPAGTADTMEVLAPVDLDLSAMRRVVEKENGCVVWGGSMSLSPADDIFIRIERVLGLDSEGQLVASILSKKIAAGSSHIVIDIPIGPTAKVRNQSMANTLKNYLESVAKELGVEVQVLLSDGSQPVGRGIGPALEAMDVLSVLQNQKEAPQDLKDRALTLAGYVLEFSPQVEWGTGKALAAEILESGQAWKKFQAICEAQGGMFEPKKAPYQQAVCSKKAGVVIAIHNHHLARIAKFAGAPKSKSAGIELLTSIGRKIEIGQPMYIIYSDSPGELNYTLDYINQGHTIIHIEEN